jgi:hypothetical protein
VPNHAAPFIDTWAPPQYVFASAGAAGPDRSPAGGAAMNAQQQSTYDPTLTYKLAGTIVLALAVVFALQASGFRFVAAVNVGFGG